MTRRPTLLDRRALWPAAWVALLAGGGWIVLRLCYRSLARDWTSPLSPPGLWNGWLLWLLLLATTAAVGAAALTRNTRPLRSIWLSMALLSDVCGLLLLLVAWDSGPLIWRDLLQLYLLLVSWLACCTAAAIALRRIGPGAAATLPLTLAALLLAAPVTAWPLVRALQGSVQTWAASLLSHACPTLALFAATAASRPYAWAQAGVMYHLTALGQDVPLPLPVWWISALAYSVVAVLLSLLAPRPALEPQPLTPLA